MKVAVSLEHVFQRTPDGRVWTKVMFAHRFFTRYLVTFAAVSVVARVQEVERPADDWQRADGDAVSFAAIPFYHGPSGYLRRYFAIRGAAARAVERESALILRVSSPIAGLMGPAIRRSKHPYGVEVVCDPWEVLSPTGVQHPLRPLMRRHFAAQLRAQCSGACAAAYVTEGALQRRYPPAPGALSVGASDVELPPSAFVAAGREPTVSPGLFRLVMVASLAQLYKAPDVLVDAIALCVGDGLDVHLTLIGDGMYRGQIEEQVRRLSLTERISFLGQVPAGEAVRAELDRADAFVLPSRTEGLPRALVEAMARGLPCIGSTVGGIPELLAPESLVPPGDAPALARAISGLARSPAQQAAGSRRNLERARDFADAVLDARRKRFFAAVAEATRTWLGA